MLAIKIIVLSQMYLNKPKNIIYSIKIIVNLKFINENFDSPFFKPIFFTFIKQISFR